MARPPGLSREHGRHHADQQGACGHIPVSLLTPEKEDFGVPGHYQDRVMGFTGPATVTFCGLWASLFPIWWSPLEPPCPHLSSLFLLHHGFKLSKERVPWQPALRPAMLTWQDSWGLLCEGQESLSSYEEPQPSVFINLCAFPCCPTNLSWCCSAG